MNKPRGAWEIQKLHEGRADLNIMDKVSPLTSPPSNPSVYNSLAYFPNDCNYNGTGVNCLNPTDGNWHCFEGRWKLNTNGNSDGILQFWFDGVLMNDAHNIPWVMGENPANRPFNRIQIGGNSVIEFNSVNGEQWYSVDDIVVSTERIGCEPVPLIKTIKVTAQ
jgi:hypothetical protein